MTEGIVLTIVAAAAGVCLVLGLAQALAPPPAPRRRRVRAREGRPEPPRPGAPAPAAPPAAAEAPGAEAPAPPARRTRAVFTPRARPTEELAPGPPEAADEAPAPVSAPQSPAVEVPPARPARAPVEELPVEECLSLHDRGEHAEVLRMAEPALERALGEGTTAPPAHEIARLWSVLALSRRALGDEEGARSALEEAVHTAPRDDRPAYAGQLAELVQRVSERLLAEAAETPEGAGEEQIRKVRQAALWLQQGVAEVPGRGELVSALERAQQGLWAAYERAAATLVRRQEFHRARRIVREALAEAEFPPERREAFGELLSQTLTGEIGQLTASAIRTLEDEREGEAVAFLERAEEVLKGMPAEALTPKRREEVNRRLWWGYTKLGMRRIEAGEHEEALGPLFHALRIEGIDPERQQESREALGRALEGVADARARGIAQLAKDGDRAAAGVEVERLKALLRESLERGLSQRDLSAALSRARRVVEWLEQGSPGERG